MFTMGSLVLQAASGIFPVKMQGPCEVLSSRSHDRALHWAFVMLERRAVKVACAVLRGRGGGNTALLPGGGQRVRECHTSVSAEMKTGILRFLINGTMLVGTFDVRRVRLRTYRTMPGCHSSL
jgi:hypothetical protein